MKATLAAVMRYSGLIEAARFINRHRLIVLTYHGVLPNGRAADDYLCRNFVDQAAFRWQMQYVAENYRCVPLVEAVRKLRNRESLPPYSLVITFDDGFRNNYTHAFPVLRALGLPATIFLTTGHLGQSKKLWTERVGALVFHMSTPELRVGISGCDVVLPTRSALEREDAAREVVRRLKRLPLTEREQIITGLESRLSPGDLHEDPDRYRFLEWADIRLMAASGIEFGSHTVNHAILASLSDEQRRLEVLESKREIERQLPGSCDLFSYPNGTASDFDDRDKANLRTAGYLCALSQLTGLNDYSTDLYAIKRLNIGRGHTPHVFRAQLSGLWSLLTGAAARFTSKPQPQRALSSPSGEPGAAGSAEVAS